MTNTAGQVIQGPPLHASAAMRKALEAHVLPISGHRHAGDVVGLGAHYRLFARQVSTTGGILPVYTNWTSDGAGPVAHGGHKTPDIVSMKDGTPLMHSLRHDLSIQISNRLAPLAGTDIQSFDLICATEGVVIFRRNQTTGSTDIIAIEDLEFVCAIPWDFCSNHQQLAFKDYVDTHLIGESRQR
jgi:hypothetical protein